MSDSGPGRGRIRRNHWSGGGHGPFSGPAAPALPFHVPRGAKGGHAPRGEATPSEIAEGKMPEMPKGLPGLGGMGGALPGGLPGLGGKGGLPGLGGGGFKGLPGFAKKKK